MGAVARRSSDAKGKTKRVRQSITSKIQQHDGKQKRLKTKLKPVKKTNAKSGQDVRKNTRSLVKKIQQRNKQKGKHAAVGLLDPSMVNVVKTRSNNNQNNSEKQNKWNKLMKNEKTLRTNKNRETNQKTKQVQTRMTRKNVSKSKKTESTKLKPEGTQLNKSTVLTNKGLKRRAKQKVENNTEKLELIKIKKIRQRKKNSNVLSTKEQKTNNDTQKTEKIPKLIIQKLEEMLANKEEVAKKKKPSIRSVSLRDRMMTKLRASRFRYLNETLYNNDSSYSKKYFKDDPSAFTAYHNGYKQQVKQWPLNPLDIIISSIKSMPKDRIIADFGCGEARLAASVPQKVHSFDFVSLNNRVTACDMAHTPLLTGGVHVVVFCLSLMGTNLNDYLIEANRVLKKDGLLKIAEVESRFDKVEDFINLLSKYGFTNTWKDLSHNLFYFLDFKKEKDIAGKRNKLPAITLKPCLYKKR